MNGKKIKFVIFGATGDLSYRKLLPALYNIYISEKNFNIKIECIGRREYTNEDFFKIINPWIKKYSRLEYTDEMFEKFKKFITYIKCDFMDITNYKNLEKKLNECDEVIYYYAVAPEFFKNITKGINTLKVDANKKVVIEKPFGVTIKEAKELEEELEKNFLKENIYHIDHYLGKEMIQNLITVRFRNPVFEALWNKDNIECIHIVASEKEGVGTRAGYYDNSGALKDMVQNHLLQILSIVAMKKNDENNSIKDRQVEILKKLKIKDINTSMQLGQYSGYLEEKNVSKNSQTETLALCKFYIEDEIWDNVPFYVLTGKKMEDRELSIIIKFKNKEQRLNNELIFKIQPQEGISLTTNLKKSTKEDEYIKENLNFLEDTEKNTKEAYERLFISLINGDHTWFATWPQIYTSWQFIENMKELYYKEKNTLEKYEKNIKGIEKFEKIFDKKTHSNITSQFQKEVEKNEAK